LQTANHALEAVWDRSTAVGWPNPQLLGTTNGRRGAAPPGDSGRWRCITSTWASVTSPPTGRRTT
jgi:hypothetical protein